MTKVSIIGSGNVAEAFAVALSECHCEGLKLHEVVGRNTTRLATIGQLTRCRTTTFAEMSKADIYIVAVSDGAIESVTNECERWQREGAVVVHTAGAVSMGNLSGVIYPMQSFTAGRRVNFEDIPLFVEWRDERSREIITNAANTLSNKVIELSSERRKSLHLAAVFACNFTNAMFTATESILRSADLDLSLYRPLVEECVAKVFEKGMSPVDAQTGAARRGDEQTMSHHRELLTTNEDLRPELTDIYNIISKYIWETSKRI